MEIMKLFKQYIKCVLIGISGVAAICLLAILIISWLFSKPQGLSKMEKVYNEHKKEFEAAAEYLYKLDFNNAHIEGYGLLWIYGGSEEGSENKYVRIKNNNVSDNFEFLMSQCKIEQIFKSNKAVYFVQWATLSASGGLVWSPDALPQILWMSELKPLKAQGWYYYETDYERFRDSDK